MRIKSISLNNFGSYENETKFDLNDLSKNKNIVIVGGKNGAGKTTLFNAIRVCLYGYQAHGYQALNSFYKNKILKLINNNAKLKLPVNASVALEFEINNGQEMDKYILERQWIIDAKSNLIEETIVYKNKTKLGDEEIIDFSVYIMQIIPPDLFNMYFFDGEKISDFFLEDGSNSRIKQAFLTLCGYDTFEIMSKNFKRQKNNDKFSDDIKNNYITSKENYEEIINKINQSKTELDDLKNTILTIDSNITKLDFDYKKIGGETQSVWDKKIENIKKEEKKREEYNAWLKSNANNMLPFLILKDEIQSLSEQINIETHQELNDNFQQKLNENHTIDLLVKSLKDNGIKINYNKAKKVAKDVSKKINDKTLENKILMLSNDEKASVVYTINQVNDFDVDSIEKTVKSISNSIKKSEKIRKELERCDVSNVQEYLTEKEKLLNQKNEVQNEIFIIEKSIYEYENELDKFEKLFEKSKKEYEIELKNGSIKDLSTKAIVFLDKLQDKLYNVQILKVEENFRKEIDVLMRKSKFITDISIDKDFNIILYNEKKFTKKEINELKSNSYEFNFSLLGDRASEQLKNDSFNGNKLTVKIDQNIMSSGEKQIYIMALYKSLISLTRFEVPFIIDTPFARIDTEHRANIIEYFFKRLEGQVFILSTNEEIEDKHIAIMKKNVNKIYTLENQGDNTNVLTNNYFGKEY